MQKGKLIVPATKKLAYLFRPEALEKLVSVSVAPSSRSLTENTETEIDLRVSSITGLGVCSVLLQIMPSKKL